jgi:hypothetical protein
MGALGLSRGIIGVGERGMHIKQYWSKCGLFDHFLSFHSAKCYRELVLSLLSIKGSNLVPMR